MRFSREKRKERGFCADGGRKAAAAILKPPPSLSSKIK